jgi:hypothetical protein
MVMADLSEPLFPSEDTMQFVTSRTSGKSNAQVVAELVKHHEPGHIFEFTVLRQALDVDANRRHTVEDVRRVVAGMYSRLLREQSRALHSVRGKGYRIAEAKDHRMLATSRKERSDRQFQKGLITLQQVKWDELGPEERKAHEGQLLIASAIWSQMKALERRQDAVESILRKIVMPNSAESTI